MIPRGLKPGDTFSDGPLLYKILSVNNDGSYISTQIEAVEEADEAEPGKLAEAAGSEPDEAEPMPVEKKPRGSRRK